MQISFLQAKVPIPRTPIDYKEYVFSFDTQQIHQINQMDMHKQTSEIIYSTLTNVAMSSSRLRVSLNKT